jgi:hypothetical protein
LVQQKIKFAVRSGGRAPHAGAASIEGGVLFDMARFNQVECGFSAGVVIVGSSLRLGEVYPRLDQYQVTVVGGRAPHVCVDGLKLGHELLNPPPALGFWYYFLHVLRRSLLADRPFMVGWQSMWCITR